MLYPRPSFCVPLWAYGHPHSACMPQPFMCSANPVPEVRSPTACCRDVASLKAALTTCRVEDVLSLLRTAPIQLGSAGYTTLITACGEGLLCTQEPPVCFCHQPLPLQPPAIYRSHASTPVYSGKRGDLAKARAVFEAAPTRNVWHVSALISAYANAGEWAAPRARGPVCSSARVPACMLPCVFVGSYHHPHWQASSACASHTMLDRPTLHASP